METRADNFVRAGRLDEVIGELEQPPADPGLKKNARGKYRTRKDKVFCSRNCKQKWRYHYVLKPGR